MKKYLIITLLIICSANIYSQSWIVITDSLPAIPIVNDSSVTLGFPACVFSLPGNPVLTDTLGIKNYSYAVDTSIGFNALKFSEPILDSTNSSFTGALLSAGGDTLRAITNQFLPATNSQINYINDLPRSNGFAGLEISLTYNTLDYGRVVVAYFRYYYNYHNNVLVSFSISGFQTNLATIISDKNLFFNSIIFN